MRPFQELEVWRISHELTLAVYRASQGFPADERYGLQSQLRRAASSVPANIAEGSALTDDHFRHHLRIALGSATELEYHLILARELGYLATDVQTELIARLTSVKRMLQRFIQHFGDDRMRSPKSQQPKARSQS
ncbi:MAG: four helix bundle protein [Chloroflexi bacterium]|nr:four helix bundle protein [Chloroflexota bacterium]